MLCYNTSLNYLRCLPRLALPFCLLVCLPSYRRDFDPSILLLLLLLRSQASQDVRVPALPDVRVALNTVAQRGFAKCARHSAPAERELNIVKSPAAVALQNRPPLSPHVLGDPSNSDRLEVVEGRVAADALEKGDRKTRARARGGGQHPVRRANAHPLRERLEPLPDGYHERPIHGRAVNPIPAHVLYLQAPVRRRLEKIGGEHCFEKG